MGTFLASALLPLAQYLPFIFRSMSRPDSAGNPTFALQVSFLMLGLLPLIALLMVSDLPREIILTRRVRDVFRDLWLPLAVAVAAGHVFASLAVLVGQPRLGFDGVSVLLAVGGLVGVAAAWVAIALLVRVRIRHDGDALVACFFTWVILVFAVGGLGDALLQAHAADLQSFDARPAWGLAFEVANPSDAVRGLIATTYPGFDFVSEGYRESAPSLYQPWFFLAALAAWIVVPLLLAAEMRREERGAVEVEA